MPTHSLHLGLNHLDPKHYQDIPQLRAAVNDANDWAAMAGSVLGYQHQETLTDKKATTKAVLKRLRKLAASMHAGDALLITYSGHGSQIEDGLSSTGDEAIDQTWCLYDRQLLDDELYAAFSRFRAGVRIVVIADCCHSGTSIRDTGDDMTPEERMQQAMEMELEAAGFQPRTLSRPKSAIVLAKNQAQYDTVRQDLDAQGPVNVAASVKLFAACQDSQVTYDGQRNGIFTDAFKNILSSGEWRDLNAPAYLLERLRSFFRYPMPNYMAYGGDFPDFERSFPLLAVLQPTGPVRPSNIYATGKAATQAPLAGIESDARATPAFYKVRLELPGGGLTNTQIEALCPAGASDITIGADGAIATVIFPATLYPTVWTVIHTIAQAADLQGLALLAEPAASIAAPLMDDSPDARAAGEEFSYLPYWPPLTQQEDPILGWHLDGEHSQLAAARDFVWDKLRKGELKENIRIGHLDTGWYPTHPGFVNNPNIRRDLTRSFVDKEKGINQAAIDLQYKNNEQQGHGSGTLGILAGWTLDPRFTDGLDLSYTGAIPFAEIVPIRIADSVIIFDTDNFCEGLEYAIEIGCEVVTMSMGGKPSRRMAQAINKAYEKGITVVTAAGNNMTKGMQSLGPKTVIWPARFERVIAACGASFNDIPYDFGAQDKYGNKVKDFSVQYMQGNWGPEKAMHKALASYTPNVPWYYMDEQKPLKKSGGGTSSSTPQIAAAAALWITLHKEELKRKGYAGTWKQVEAVRQVLFDTADKSFVENKKYYGNGILRAMDALQRSVPEITNPMRAEEAESSQFGLTEALGLFLKRRRDIASTMPGPALRHSLEMELQHLLLDDAVAGNSAEDTPSPETIREAVSRSKDCSKELLACIVA